MAKNDDKSSFFARYIDTPSPTKKAQKPSSAQRLLDFLQHWNEPVICMRDVYTYGPRPRDRKKASNAAEILVKTGWLVPVRSHRYDRHVWQVVRKPIIQPTVEM
jgi:hypothetical protein